jgi:FtsP/CotA-like multicopper oxidase with cupredoxin domain
MTPRRHGSHLHLTRRSFLLAAAATGVLAACGSDGDGATSDSTPTDDGTGGDAGVDGETYTLVQRFPQNVQEPGALRLPISLATADGRLLQDVPDTLSAQVVDAEGRALGEPITAVRREVAPGPYYDFRTELAEPGVYALVVDGGPPDGAAFQVMEPGSVAVPGPGDPMPPFDTPTVDDLRGVDPLCTRSPDPCPFHDVTLTDALATGPVVYLVGTPAFCQTGTCAPALESLIELAAEFDDRYTFVHAEIYTDDTATTVAPAVDAASLTYEPALFITDASGTVVERLDAVWDTTELAEVLERLG